MKYKKTDYKGNSTHFMLKIAEKKVPFNKEGEQEMYYLRPTGAGVKSFESLARGYIRHLGINEYLATALAAMISKGICFWIDSGYAVNIEKVGTLKPVINCKAHLDPRECSVEDVKSVKMQFYPCKEINRTLEKIAFRVKNRKEFVQRWQEKQKRKKE